MFPMVSKNSELSRVFWHHFAGPKLGLRTNAPRTSNCLKSPNNRRTSLCKSVQNPQHGLGLFATVDFQPGDIVTWYDGFVIPKEELWAKFVLYQPGTHTLTLDASGFAVQGLQQPVEGWGGASFINHRPCDLANSEYCVLPAGKHNLDYNLPALDTDEVEFPICIIVAIRKIAANS